MWFVKNMAIRLSRVVLRCAPILLVAALLPAPYGATLPASLEAALLFPISMLLGFLVMVAFSMLVYISAFYTISPNGVRILVTSVLEFLAGGVLPIPFFPDWLRPVMYALPFASMQNTPYLIYVGHFAAGDALGGMVMQLFWVIALVLMGKGWMNRALKKVVVQGG